MANFGGDTYSAEHDEVRLTKQLAVLYAFMIDGAWRTLAEISAATEIPEPSASARLRDLRKDKNGSWIVNRRPRGDRSGGLWEYQLLPPDGTKQTEAPRAKGVQAPAIQPGGVEIPTDAQLQEFVEWLRPRWIGWKVAGGVMPTHGVVVCKWLAAGAKR